ncbi:D-alanyl-lipoteichoic acid biosynthesis protein DltD [Clostridium beijerinckii]|uniref:D-alanyl-lipoteichoic acid biosynthesis protein DltD n=1 Tax=Clostridium beijerinckii TaxID=1520 RepID=UPI00047A3F76|nr:D-alanyl-lipoteichoic acid biosynthesis protein DltD [Clostridium beijerinckii]
MKKKLIYMLFPIIAAVVTVMLLNIFLDKEIGTMLKSKDLTEINIEYGSSYKDRGLVYNEFVTNNNYQILEGSSELGAPVSQLATTFFPVEGMDTIVTNGRAYCQDLTQISNLGSQNTQNKPNVAFIISLQWFMGDHGVDGTDFQANFAPVQFYKFLSNKEISEEHKKTYAARVDKLLTGSSQYIPEKLYAKFYTNDNLISKMSSVIFKPYFVARENIVELKDKGLLYRRLKKLPEKSEKQLRTVDWNEEYKKAEEEAKKQVTNNEFYVYDTYYDKNLKNNLQSQKDINKNVDLMNSKEFDDYELYLDTCVDLGIKPYIILAPTNGRWYDYTGMTKQSRDEFFDKVEEMAKERGFEVLNLKDQEYTPYFMCDVMHLGWKGWLEIDEQLYKRNKEK